MITKDDLISLQDLEKYLDTLTTNEFHINKDVTYIKTSKVANELQKIKHNLQNMDDFDYTVEDIEKQLYYLIKTLRAKEEKK